MAKILIAASPEPQAIIRRLLKRHELSCAETMTQGEVLLQDGTFDLILCTIVFDDSRMFEFLRLVKANRKWKRIPFVCLRVRPKTLDYRLAIEGVQIASKVLGATAFLDIDSYRVEGKDPETALGEAIESFLPSMENMPA